MSKSTCKLDGCDKPHKGHGYCNLHYQRFRKYGHPGEASPRIVKTHHAGGPCSVEGCDRAQLSKGLCSAHYEQMRRTGALKAVREYEPTIEGRFWAKVEKTDDCWVWTARKNQSGYGEFGNEGSKLAHRFSWAMHNGPIPDGMEIDHICFTPACVRPDHLRLATRKQNCEYHQGPNKNNKYSGVRGVTWDKGAWAAYVVHHRKKINLGRFSSMDEAAAVAAEARARLFTF